MFKRKIYNDMISWKESLKVKKKALVIRGARQIGKTTIAIKFAEEFYKNYVYINFKDNDNLKKIFDKDLIIDNIIRDLSANLPNVKFIPYETVLIFDEVQECSNARYSVKPFMLDGRFDIICTGSLLGIRGYNKKKSKGVPTGYEKMLYMKSMDFEEYLWAKGISNEIITYINDSFNNKEKVSDSINETMNSYFKEYLCVGGMPEVINVFLNTHDMNQVYDTQKDILEQYKDDFGKHLDENEKETTNYVELEKILEVFNSIPSQLAKENKKFQYSVIKKHARASEYRNAIQWLEDAGIITLCYNLSNLELPLEGNKIEDVFKIYVTDTGLFVSMLEKGTVADILGGNLKVYKGAIFENIIADAFNKMHKDLYYYHKQSGLEIDFVTRYNNELTLIEVKSNNGNAKSLKEVLNNKDKYDISSNFKLADTNIGTTNGINTIPLYMAFLIK